MAPTKSDAAVAFTGNTVPIDHPKHHHHTSFVGRDTFAAVAARSVPTGKPGSMLPTPPNSISPNLPPQGFKPQVQATTPATPATPIHVDSDIDLQDAGTDDNVQAVKPQHGFVVASDKSSIPFDAAGAITPSLLARHHLPDILLAHGPLAIRHVMGYLTTSVPGFSGIPPAKARRLVVGALEGRGNGGEGGGVNGDVEFEKVGWGRWDARIKGQPPRESRQKNSLLGISPPASVPSSYANSSLAIPGKDWMGRRTSTQAGRSMTGESFVFSHDEEMEMPYLEDITMAEHEADKMSFDGEESYSSSEAAPEEGPVLDEDPDDVTDEEDWAAIGAAALRKASYPALTGRNYMATRVYNSNRSGGGPVTSALAKPTPPALVHNNRKYHLSNNHHYSDNSIQDGVLASDVQEREAIEALLRLGKA